MSVATGGLSQHDRGGAHQMTHPCLAHAAWTCHERRVALSPLHRTAEQRHQSLERLIVLLLLERRRLALGPRERGEDPQDMSMRAGGQRGDRGTLAPRLGQGNIQSHASELLYFHLRLRHAESTVLVLLRVLRIFRVFPPILSRGHDAPAPGCPGCVCVPFEREVARLALSPQPLVGAKRLARQVAVRLAEHLGVK